MGNAASNAANEAAEGQKREIDQMMAVLRNKRDAMLAEIKNARGSADAVKKYEIAGGRTVMRVSQIRVSAGSDVDKDITEALGDFFNAAQGGIKGENEKAKASAVKGAQGLLSAGLSAMMGVTNGQSQEKRDFVVLFMNNAFVRVDYYVYTYSISAKKWGAEKNKAGAVYVTDMAVLDMADLTANEIDFLLSQALYIEPEDSEYLNIVKLRLIESAVLSRMLKKDTLSFADISRIAEGLAKVENDIDKAYSQMKNFNPDAASRGSNIGSRSLPAPPISDGSFLGTERVTGEFDVDGDE